jgi:hypothetical protein
VHTRKPLPITAGHGSLICARSSEPVEYSIASNDTLKTGKGSVQGDPEHMKAAFSTGLASLKLETGAEVPVFFVGYSSGSSVAYFEIRRPG